MLVGDGDLRPEIEQKVRDLGLSEKVIFTGVRSDVNDLMQGMDVFLFPSLYEGLPVTMVEAQASGLKCIISDKVPLECKMTENVVVVKLEESPQKWAKEILKYEKYERQNTKEEIVKSLQRALNKDYNCGLDVDGIIGPLTTKAVNNNMVRNFSVSEFARWVQELSLIHI